MNKSQIVLLSSLWLMYFLVLITPRPYNFVIALCIGLVLGRIFTIFEELNRLKEKYEGKIAVKICDNCGCTEAWCECGETDWDDQN